MELTMLDEPKRRGRLVADAEVVRGERRTYRCRCDCGSKVEVEVRPFQVGNITACDDCKAAGLAPAAYVRNFRRVYVTVDPDQMALLGLPAEVTAPELRALLSEVSRAVRAAPEVPLTAAEWKALLKATARVRLTDDELSPASVVALLAEEAAVEVPTDQLTALAVLAALRWGKRHPDGQWWRPDNRTEG